jgi:protein-histidine pros-kinase
VIGFTSVLLMKLPGPLTADQESQLRTVQSSAQHLLALINDLLDLAKIDAGSIALQLDEVSCEEVVNEVAAALKPAALAKQIGFDVDIAGPLAPIRTDRRAVRQILINLVGNAIKFTDAGRVAIEVHQDRRDGPLMTSFSVVDTGPGIAEKDKAHLFEAFRQLDATAAHRHEGSGLGLHLSQKLANVLGANIEFDTELGKGSRFVVRLPEAI